jgi:hypothetical protein
LSFFFGSIYNTHGENTWIKWGLYNCKNYAVYL